VKRCSSHTDFSMVYGMDIM